MKLDLKAIESRARAAVPYEKSETAPRECPLCGGDMDEATVYDAKPNGVASTIVAYGIGKDLKLAEEYVETGPADTVTLVAKALKLLEYVRCIAVDHEHDATCHTLRNTCYVCEAESLVSEFAE